MISKIQKFVVVFFVFIAMGITKSHADDWDDFYNKYSSKAFVITWKETWLDPTGKIDSNYEHEFGYTLVSPNRIRQFTRNTDIKNNSSPVAKWDETISKGDFRAGTRTIYSYNIEKNSIIDSEFWKVTSAGKPSTLRRYHKITAIGNGCKFEFFAEDMRLADGWKMTMSDKKCVVVNK